MSDYVVDASVAVKWLLIEEHRDAALRLMEGGNRLHAPDFILLELANVICTRVRRREMAEHAGVRAHALFQTFLVQMHDSAPLFHSAFSIALRTRQSVYDSLYVALAVVLGARLVTADRRLVEGLSGRPFEERVVWVGDVG